MKEKGMLGWVVFVAMLLVSGVAYAQGEASGLPEIVEQYLPPLLIAVIGVLTSLAAWLKSPTAKAIRQRVKNETAASALTWLSNVVFDYVGHAAQLTVEALKKDYADGKITEEEYRRTLAALKDRMLKDLLDAALGRLQASGAVPDGIDGIEVAKGIIDRKIETAVPVVKASRVDPPPPSAAG
jgi:hypothetical protein